MNETKQLKLTQLSRNYSGFYSEMLIQNSTRNTIIFIDSENNKSAIPPVSATIIGREAIHIWLRSSIGKTVDDNGRSLEIPGQEIYITKQDLMKDGGVYVPQINGVICTQEMAMSMVHPKTSATYDDALSQLMESVESSEDSSTTFSILANDPDKRCDRLYTYVGDILVEIEVTHMAGSSELVILTNQNGEQKIQTINIDDFLNSTKDDVLEIADGPISFITTNKRKIGIYKKEYKRIAQVEVDSMFKREADKYAKQVKDIVESNKLDTAAKEAEIEKLKIEMKKLKAEYEDVNALYNSLKASVNSCGVFADAQVKNKEIDTDIYIAQMRKEEADLKRNQLIWSGLAPIIAIVGVELVKAIIKTKSDKEK